MDAHKGTERLFLKEHTQAVTGVVFSSDGKRIFAWDETKKVLAWTVADGKSVDPVDAPPMPAIKQARSPDGFLLAQVRENDVVVTDTRRPTNNAWPLPDRAERHRHHSQQAAAAEEAGQWFAVAFHVGRLLLDDPDNADLKHRREAALQKHSAAKYP